MGQKLRGSDTEWTPDNFARLQNLKHLSDLIGRQDPLDRDDQAALDDLLKPGAIAPYKAITMRLIITVSEDSRLHEYPTEQMVFAA